MKREMIHVVVNPTAGSGKAKSAVSQLLRKIKENPGRDINLTYTKEKNDALFITRKAIADGASMIVAVGGDGTVNEVVNGFFLGRSPINPMCELGIINCGTGGGYARTLNLPVSINNQFELLLHSESRAMDVGYITCHNHYGKSISRAFVNECQIGIGNNVASAVGGKSKIFGGTIAFGIAAAVMALFISPQRVLLKFDNEEFTESTLIGLVVGNGTECAGGMKLTPDAMLNDGLFDVLSIHQMSVLKRIINLSKVYSGGHIFSSGFSIRRCQKLKIESGIKISLEADGEILGNSPFDIEILPSAIRVKSTY